MSKVLGLTSVLKHKAKVKHNGELKTYFRTSIPFDVAIEYLKLKTDENKTQKLAWKIDKGKVIVEAV